MRSCTARIEAAHRPQEGGFLTRDQKHKRRSIRLAGHDYAADGAYFVTICAYERNLLFGKAVEGQVRLTRLGALVERSLLEVPSYYEHILLDEFVVMPNHLHFVLILRRGTINRAPTKEGFGRPVAGSIPTVIRAFKGGVTRVWRRKIGDPDVVIWQRGYYEHGIRDDSELNEIRGYIRSNPAGWIHDHFYEDP